MLQLLNLPWGLELEKLLLREESEDFVLLPAAIQLTLGFKS